LEFKAKETPEVSIANVFLWPKELKYIRPQNNFDVMN